MLIIGDLHLDYIDALIPNGTEKALQTLDNTLRDFDEKNVLFLGDIFNTPSPDDTYVVDFLKVLIRHKKKYHVLVGNHDRKNKEEHSLLMVDFVGRHFLDLTVYNEPKIVAMGGQKYFMCPSPYVQDAPKGVSYAFGHFPVTGAVSDTGFVVKNKTAPKGRWILGDFHTYQHTKNYTYVGSLFQTKFFENLPKGVIILGEDEPEFHTIKPEYVLDRVTIEKPSDFQKLRSDIFYSVSFSPDLDLDANWQSKYPNIIRVEALTRVSKRAKILFEKVSSADPLNGLSDYLRQQGLTDKQIRKAYEILGVTPDD